MVTFLNEENELLELLMFMALSSLIEWVTILKKKEFRRIYSIFLKTEYTGNKYGKQSYYGKEGRIKGGGKWWNS